MIDQDVVTARVIRNLPPGVTLSSLTNDELCALIDVAAAELIDELTAPPVGDLPPLDP